jgi:site-specific recombinase XerD
VAGCQLPNTASSPGKKSLLSLFAMYGIQQALRDLGFWTRVAPEGGLRHRKALKLAKLRPFEVYSIRHTFLTLLGESGCDVWTLARIAGHSNISISQSYVHPSEDAVLNALSRLGGAQF